MIFKSWTVYARTVDPDIAARRKYPEPDGWIRETETSVFALVWCPSPIQASGAVRDSAHHRADGWDYSAPEDQPWCAWDSVTRRRTYHETAAAAMAAVDQEIASRGLSR